VPTKAREDTGEIVVPVEAGMNRVQVTLIRTWDRTLGAWISVAVALALMGWHLSSRSVG